MFLKLMGGEDVADIQAGKTFRMIECREVQFQRGADGGLGWALIDGADTIPLEGNAYILNSAGKTVDSFRPNARPALS
jgi:hypothetical protein